MDGGGLSALERLPDALLHRVAAELGPLQAVEVAMLHCVSRRLREAARGAEYALLDLSRGFFAFGGVGVAREAALRRVARRAAFGWYRGVRGVRLRYGSRVEAEVASELLGALHACPLERAEIESDAPLASGDEEDELEDEEDEGEEEEELGGGGGEEDEERKQRPAGRRRGPPSRSLDLLQALAPFSTLEVVEASLEVMWDPRPFSWAALPRLRALRLPRRLLRDSEVSALVSALPGLRRLAICAVGGAALQHLTRLPLLEAVEVEPLDGDCAAVLALLRGPARARLRRLAVPFGRVPPALLEEVASLPLLESLVIALEEESAAGVPVLGQAARLASLDARVVLAGSGASAGLLRALGDAAGAAPALRTLDLTVTCPGGALEEAACGAAAGLVERGRRALRRLDCHVARVEGGAAFVAAVAAAAAARPCPALERADAVWSPSGPQELGALASLDALRAGGAEVRAALFVPRAADGLPAVADAAAGYPFAELEVVG